MKRTALAILILFLGVAGLFLLGRGIEAPAPIGSDRGDRLSAPPPSFRVAPPAEPVDVSFQRRSVPLLGFQERDYPFLEDEDPEQSVSVGTVTQGYLVNASELTLPGAHYRILPVQLMRGLRYTSDEMAALLRSAAAAVAEEFPGATLWLGNLGRRGGGDIPWSVSHNSGRDADLAFYFVDELGQPQAPPDLLSVGPDLTFTHQGVVYRFDLARNWALVRALLAHEETQIQFLFVANFMKSALLRYASERGEDASLIARAEVVMGQPGRSNPHDDHLHVRIYCSRDDLGGGCVNIGRIHPWVDTYPAARSERIADARELLDHGDSEQRARAIERLVILESRRDRRAFRDLLTDPTTRVRAAAARGLAWGGDADDLPALVEAFEGERDGDVLAALVSAIAAAGRPDGETFLVQRLSQPLPVVLRGTEIDLRALIADAIAEGRSEGRTSALIGLLDSRDAYVRARATWALSRIANRRLGMDWEDASLDRETRQHGAEIWRRWLDAHGGEPRDSWMVSGFAEAGYAVLDDGVNLDVLATAVESGRDYVRYNAQRGLMGLLDRRPPSLSWPTHDASWYWRSAVGPSQ